MWLTNKCGILDIDSLINFFDGEYYEYKKQIIMNCVEYYEAVKYREEDEEN